MTQIEKHKDKDVTSRLTGDRGILRVSDIKIYKAACEDPAPRTFGKKERIQHQKTIEINRGTYEKPEDFRQTLSEKIEKFAPIMEGLFGVKIVSPPSVTFSKYQPKKKFIAEYVGGPTNIILQYPYAHKSNWEGAFSYIGEYPHDLDSNIAHELTHPFCEEVEKQFGAHSQQNIYNFLEEGIADLVATYIVLKTTSQPTDNITVAIKLLEREEWCLDGCYRSYASLRETGEKSNDVAVNERFQKTVEYAIATGEGPSLQKTLWRRYEYIELYSRPILTLAKIIASNQKLPLRDIIRNAIINPKSVELTGDTYFKFKEVHFSSDKLQTMEMGLLVDNFKKTAKDLIKTYDEIVALKKRLEEQQTKIIL